MDGRTQATARPAPGTEWRCCDRVPGGPVRRSLDRSDPTGLGIGCRSARGDPRHDTAPHRHCDPHAPGASIFRRRPHPGACTTSSHRATGHGVRRLLRRLPRRRAGTRSGDQCPCRPIQTSPATASTFDPAGSVDRGDHSPAAPAPSDAGPPVDARRRVDGRTGRAVRLGWQGKRVDRVHRTHAGRNSGLRGRRPAGRTTPGRDRAALRHPYPAPLGLLDRLRASAGADRCAVAPRHAQRRLDFGPGHPPHRWSGACDRRHAIRRHRPGHVSGRRGIRPATG